MPKLLSRLPESSRHRGAASRAGTAVSVVAHAALITLAVVATAVSTPTPPPKPRIEIIDVFHVDRDHPRPIAEPHHGAGSGGAPSRRAGPPRTAEAPPLPTPIDLEGIVDPTAPSRNPIGEEFAQRSGSGATGGEPGTGPAGGGDGAPFDARVVEVPAALRRGSPVPRYPDALRSARLEGRVVVRFVVDTAGRVEPASVRIVSSTDPRFTSSVRATLPALRFSPARARGRTVRQYVELPFEFALER